MTVAPNSLLAMDLSLNEAALPAGTYTFHSQASAGNQEWHWRKNFTITQMQVKKWSASTSSAKSPQFFLIGGSILLLIVISVYFYLKKSRTK